VSEKQRLSVSALNMLVRCGEQYRRRYLLNEKIPPGFALTVGIATDKSIGEDLGNKIQKGELLPDEAVKDIARDALVAEWDKGVILEEEYAALGFKKARAEAIDTSVMLSLLHHEEAAPTLEPTVVQRYWRLDVEGLPVELSGYIDIQEGAKSIRDSKTSKRSPASDEADKSFQLSTYAMAVDAIDGSIPEKVCLDYLVHTKQPKLVQLESKRERSDFDHVLRRIENASLAIEKGIFTPAPVDAWQCSKKWCGWHETCRFVRRPVSVTVIGEK